VAPKSCDAAAAHSQHSDCKAWKSAPLLILPLFFSCKCEELLTALPAFQAPSLLQYRTMSWYMVTSGSVQINQSNPCLDSVSTQASNLQLPSAHHQSSRSCAGSLTSAPANIWKVSTTSSSCTIINLAFKVLNLLLTHIFQVLLFDLALLMGLSEHYCLWWTLDLPAQSTFVVWVLDLRLLLCLLCQAC